MRSGLFIQTGLRGVEREESLRYVSKMLPLSVVLFSNDFRDEKELAELIKKINHIYVVENNVDAPFIAVDQEGGNVVRIPWIDYNPSNLFLGKLDDPKFTNYVGRLTGYQLNSLGIRWNLAPVLDTLNGYNPVILERSFGSDLELIAKHGVEFIRGIQSYGVRATAKHFPGHGSVMVDSHVDLPEDRRNIESIINDAYPFRKAAEAGVSSIMLSHVLYNSLDDNYPATLSSAVQKLLRKDFNYKNLIISDSMDMKAIKGRYDVSEIIKGSIKNEVDVLENADIVGSMEFYEEIQKIDHASLKKKEQRILEFMEPVRKMSHRPSPYLLKSVETVSPIVRRVKMLDPEKETDLVLMDSKDESQVAEITKSTNLVSSHLGSLNLDLKLHYGIEFLENMKDAGRQIIFVGRNEHLRSRVKLLNEISERNICVFISTSFDGDLGIISENMGYISAYSKKPSVIVGAIMKAFGFMS